MNVNILDHTMDWKEFTTELASHTAWPIVIIFILIIFRNELRSIFGRINSLKIKDLEIDFTKVTQQSKALLLEEKTEKDKEIMPVFNSLEEQVLDAVERAPSASILLGWSILEAAISSTVARLAISPESPSYRSPLHNIEVLSQYTTINKNRLDLINEMRQLRNKVAHHNYEMLAITQDQAQGYANACIEMIQYLENLSQK